MGLNHHLNLKVQRCWMMSVTPMLQSKLRMMNFFRNWSDMITFDRGDLEIIRMEDPGPRGNAACPHQSASSPSPSDPGCEESVDLSGSLSLECSSRYEEADRQRLRLPPVQAVSIMRSCEG